MWFVLLAGLWGFALLPQSGLPPDVLQLAKIKLHMAENLDRLPNYTCLESIERSRRRVNGRRFELVDALRIEVAFVDNKELFAWPGSRKFEDREISKMVGGTIGNGSFALHARSLFLSSAPMFTYAGERIRPDGRKTLRYDYRVPVMHSGFRLKVPPREGIAGYHGSFWADAETLDVLRIEIYADDIPVHLPLSAASDAVEYQRVRIGEGEFLLPSSSELILADLAGSENRNRTQFTGCRQYMGESVLSFGDPPPDAAPVKAPVEMTLPAGLEMTFRLEGEITIGESAVGDPVRGILEHDVRWKRELLVKRGAVAVGRVASLVRARGVSEIGAVGIEFDRLEFGDRYAELHLQFDRASILEPPVAVNWRTTYPQPASPGIGMLYLRGSRIRLPRGLRTSWRTISPQEELK